MLATLIYGNALVHHLVGHFEPFQIQNLFVALDRRISNRHIFIILLESQKIT